MEVLTQNVGGAVPTSWSALESSLRSPERSRGEAEGELCALAIRGVYLARRGVIISGHVREAGERSVAAGAGVGWGW